MESDLASIHSQEEQDVIDGKLFLYILFYTDTFYDGKTLNLILIKAMHTHNERYNHENASFH